MCVCACVYLNNKFSSTLLPTDSNATCCVRGMGGGGGGCRTPTPHRLSWGHWCLLGPCTAGAVGNDSCRPPRTLICYCSRAAVQHAAESRWQPGRSGGRWGWWWGGPGGEDTSAWHMWLAAGVGARVQDGRMTGGWDCAGGEVP